MRDALGNIRTITDGNGSITESRLYSPYGEPYGGTGSSQTVYGFTGEPTDSTGFVHLRARYYNPSLGQFMNLDPKETANRFAYVNGNPINATDPSGLYAESAAFDPGPGGGRRRRRRRHIPPALTPAQRAAIGGGYGAPSIRELMRATERTPDEIARQQRWAQELERKQQINAKTSSDSAPIQGSILPIAPPTPSGGRIGGGYGSGSNRGYGGWGAGPTGRGGGRGGGAQVAGFPLGVGHFWYNYYWANPDGYEWDYVNGATDFAFPPGYGVVVQNGRIMVTQIDNPTNRILDRYTKPHPGNNFATDPFLYIDPEMGGSISIIVGGRLIVEGPGNWGPETIWNCTYNAGADLPNSPWPIGTGDDLFDVPCTEAPGREQKRPDGSPEIGQLKSIRQLMQESPTLQGTETGGTTEAYATTWLDQTQVQVQPVPYYGYPYGGGMSFGDPNSAQQVADAMMNNADEALLAFALTAGVTTGGMMLASVLGIGDVWAGYNVVVEAEAILAAAAEELIAR